MSPAVPLIKPSVERHLGLVEIDSLRRYESADPPRVAAMVHSLLSLELLIDPIVADVETGVLIDGHHRAAAFEWMGMERIPCFDVRYESPQVTVRGWMRTSTAPAATVAEVFASLTHRSDGDWRVVSTSGNGGRVASAAFADPLSAAHFLERVVACLQSRGYEEELVPQTDPSGPADGGGSAASIFLDPFPEQKEVLAAIRDDRRFPEQVNRHLVDGRPLNVRAPLEATATPERFETFLARRRHEAEVSWQTGVVHLGRWFEERVQFWRDASPPGA